MDEGRLELALEEVQHPGPQTPLRHPVHAAGCSQIDQGRACGLRTSAPQGGGAGGVEGHEEHRTQVLEVKHGAVPVRQSMEGQG